jgi:hypothetical protein
VSIAHLVRYIWACRRLPSGLDPPSIIRRVHAGPIFCSAALNLSGMRFSLVPAVGALLFGATLITAAPPPNDAAAILQDLQRQVEAKLHEANKLAPRARPGHGGQTCTLANAAVRKDWYVHPLLLFSPDIRHGLETKCLVATVLLFAAQAGQTPISHRLLLLPMTH